MASNHTKSAIVVLLLLSMIPITAAEITECVNCSDCESKLNAASPGDTVLLINDIEEDSIIMLHNISGVMFDGGGHTITGEYGFAGINLDQSTNNTTIRNLTIENFIKGIYVFCSNENKFYDVTASHNYWGISTTNSDHQTFDNVVCNMNSQTGIYLHESQQCNLTYTQTNSNLQCGIYAFHSPNTTILDGVSSYNHFAGVYLDTGGNNVVSRMHLVNNRDPGLIINNAPGNLIYDNEFWGNDWQSGDFWDAYVGGITTYQNTWNVTPHAGTNIIGGDIIAGNYWYNTSCVDADNDGICDDPHWINESCDLNIDYSPLADAPQCYVCGDVDCNDYVSANDVVEVYRKAVDPNYQLVNEWGADADGNGYVSANDVVEIYLTAVDPNHQLNCIQLT